MSDESGKSGLPTNPDEASRGLSPRLDWPLERYEIVRPDVPAAWEGTTILHLSDLHVRKDRPWTADLRRVLAAVRGVEVDFVVLTGDYPDKPCDEAAAVGVVEELVAACRARHGIFGIWGNHDSAGMVASAARIRGVNWLDGDGVDLGRGLAVAGTSFPEDMMSLAAGLEHRGISPCSHFVLTLVHYPTEAYAAAAMGLQFVVAGHTHGGQVRISPGLAPHTSGDMPTNMAAGLFAVGNTYLAVSRGLGEAVAQVRANCPVQAPVYVLKRGLMELAADGQIEGRRRLLAALRRW